MPLTIRRVIVSNDKDGASTVIADETLTEAEVGSGVSIRGIQLWATDSMPVDNSAEAVTDQKIGALKRFNNLYVHNGEGSAFHLTEFPPNSPAIFHRTETVDYDVVLYGEVDLDFDNGETVHLKAGDTIVNRGTMHAWHNRSSEPAAIAAVMVDAKPVVVNDKVLGQHYPADATPQG